MTPHLFLDVDGVLNHFGRCGQGLETDKCELLREIVAATGCHIVLSSTWRKQGDACGRIVRLLDGIGATFAGCTPVLDCRQPSGLWTAVTRGQEIAAWLEVHPEVTRCVIVDDDEDMAPLRAHLVLTNSFEGLTPAHAAKILQRLTTPLP